MPTKTERDFDREQEVFEDLITSIGEAIHDTLEGKGNVPVSMIEAALGYNLTKTFELYPVEFRGKAIEHFIGTLREYPQHDIN